MKEIIVQAFEESVRHLRASGIADAEEEDVQRTRRLAACACSFSPVTVSRSSTSHAM